jgi:hypothetical protein
MAMLGPLVRLRGKAAEDYRRRATLGGSRMDLDEPTQW